MAKDTTGFMAKDMGQPTETKAAPTSLIEQAGAYEGRAAELDGIKTAEAITHYTKQGKAAYEGWVESEAAKAATAITDKLNTPEFMGPEAYQANKNAIEAQDALKLSFAAEQSAGPVDPAVVQEYKDAAQRVVQAKEAGTLSQGQATAHLAMEMRRLIASNPAEAASIRKVFNVYTGRGDWDVRPIEAGLTAHQKESAAAKQMVEMHQKEAWELFQSGIGSMLGMKSYAETFQHVQAGSDTAVRMSTMYQAGRLTEHANKAMTTGNMNQFYSSAILSAGAARVTAVTPVIENLKMQGIDILNMSSPTEAQRPAIMEAFRDMRVAERNALEGSIKMLENRLAANPNMDATIVNDTMEKLKKQLANTPLTADFDNMLNELKMSATDRNMKADTVLKTAQIRDLTLKTTWSEDMLARMKDPRTRANMIKDYPNNPAVKELADVFEGRQGGFSKEMKDMEMIADGLFNAAAPWAHKAAAQQAATTDAGKKQIAAVTQIEVGRGVEALQAGVPATPSKAAAAIVAAKNFNPVGKDGTTIYNDVMSGRSEAVFKDDTTKLADYNKAVVGRAERFLAQVDGNSYPAKVKEALAVATARKAGATLAVEDGLVVLKNAKITGNVGADESIFKLQQQIVEVNKLISMQTKILGENTRAQRFVDEVRTGVAKKPGLVQEALSNAPDNLTVKPTVASQGDVRKTESMFPNLAQGIETKDELFRALQAGTITGAEYDAISADMKKRGIF